MSTHRFESIPRTNLLEGIRVIVTGCGYKPVRKRFYSIEGAETHDSIYDSKGLEMKANIGAATAFVLAKNGADVLLVSKNLQKIENIKISLVEDQIPESRILLAKVDLLNENSVTSLVKNLPNNKQFYWFNSIGLGAGSYQLKDDNPYLHLEDIPLELLEQETKTVLRGTHNLMRYLIPIFREQRKSKILDNRIAIVSSMSAVRGYGRGGTHCAAKGAISRYTNSAMLDLWRDNILVTDIRPGAIDTGMYDNSEVQNAVCEISDEYGGTHRKRFALAPPISVGYTALYAFTSPSHITSINLVAQGQFPNEGS